MKHLNRDFPGGPVVNTPHFQCREHEYDPWSGMHSAAKKLKTKPLKLNLTHNKDYVSGQHYIHFQIQDDLNR